MVEVCIVLLIVLVLMCFVIGMLIKNLKKQLASMSDRSDVWESRSNDWEARCTRTQMLTSVFEDKLIDYAGKELVNEIREKHLDRLRWMRDHGYIA